MWRHSWMPTMCHPFQEANMYCQPIQHCTLVHLEWLDRHLLWALWISIFECHIYFWFQLGCSFVAQSDGSVETKWHAWYIGGMHTVQSDWLQAMMDQCIQDSPKYCPFWPNMGLGLTKLAWEDWWAFHFDGGFLIHFCTWEFWHYRWTSSNQCGSIGSPSGISKARPCLWGVGLV